MGSSILSGSLASQVQTSLLQSREDRMIHQLQSKPAADSDAKIDKSAQEFESMLLGTWLQQAEQSMANVPGGDEDGDDAVGRDQMMSLGVQSLSTALAASGGIGIGKMIAHALHAAADRTKAAETAAESAASSTVTPQVTVPAETTKIDW
jgi:Rod binding domain-containing protein